LRVTPWTGLTVTARQPNSGVRLAEKYRALLAQAGDDGAVFGGRRRAQERPRAVTGRPAFDVDFVLDRDRNTVDQAGRLAPHPAFFRCPGFGQRRFWIRVDESIDVRLQPLHPSEHCLGHFQRGKLAAAVMLHKVGRAHPNEIVVHACRFARFPDARNACDQAAKQVTIRKRLDVDGEAKKWIRALPGKVVRNWSVLPAHKKPAHLKPSTIKMASASPISLFYLHAQAFKHCREVLDFEFNKHYS
jgi:hypothetical protein